MITQPVTVRRATLVPGETHVSIKGERGGSFLFLGYTDSVSGKRSLHFKGGRAGHELLRAFRPDQVGRVHRRKVAGAVSALALLLLAGCSQQTPGTPTPAPVPQACLDALQAADESHLIAGDALSAAGNGVFAASELDVLGLEEASARLNELAPRLDEVMARYDEASKACAGGGRP